MARCRINNKDINTSKDLMQELRNMGYMDNNDIIHNVEDILAIEEIIKEHELESILEIVEIEDNNGNVYTTVNLKSSFNYNNDRLKSNKDIEVKSLIDFHKKLLSALYDQQHQLKALLFSKGENISQQEYNDINFDLKKIDIQIEELKNLKEKFNKEIINIDKGRTLYNKFLAQAYNIIKDVIGTKDVRAEDLLKAKNILQYIKDLEEVIVTKSFGKNPANTEFVQELFKTLPLLEEQLKDVTIDFVKKVEVLSSDKNAARLFEEQLENGLDDINFIDKWFYDPSITLSGNEAILESIMHRYAVDQITELETQGAALNDKLAKADKKLDSYVRSNNIDFLLNKAIKIGNKFSINYRKFMVKDEITGLTNKIINKYTPLWFKRVEAIKAVHQKYITAGNNKEAARVLRDFLYSEKSEAIVLDYSRLDEESYFKEISEHLGEHQTRKEFNKAKKLYKQFLLAKEFFIQENKHHRGENSLIGNLEIQKWIEANDPSLANNFLEGKSDFYTLEFSVIIPRKFNKKYFDQQYEQLEKHKPIVEYIDVLREHNDFKNQHDPTSNNNFDATVPIIKQTFRDKLVELLSKREILKAIKLFYAETTSDIRSDVAESKFTKKLPVKSKAWERFKNGLLLLASRKVDVISPVKTYQRHQVSKTFLSNNKAEIEAKAVRLKQLYGLKGSNFTVNKKGTYDTLLQSTTIDGTANVFDKLYNIVKDQGISKERFAAYIIDNYKIGVFNLDKFLENIVVNEMLQENSVNLTEAFALQTQNVARYAGSQLALPTSIIIKELNDSIRGDKSNASTRTDEWTNRVVKLQDTREIWGNSDNISYENLDEVRDTLETIENSDNLSVKDLKKLRRFIESNEHRMVPGDWLFLLARMTRFMSLSFSPISAIRNLIEGEMTIKVMTEVFSSYGLINSKDVRDNDKTRIFLERVAYMKGTSSPDNIYGKLHHFTKTHRLLQDAKNNLQRALQTSNEGRESVANSSLWQPYGMLQATESYNQYPFIAALMKNVELTGKDGTKSNLLDAIENYTIKDDNGKVIEQGIKLKENFDTDTYRNEFISPDGSPRSKEYKDFAYKATFMIKYTNGDFDELSGNMAKSNPIGNVMSVFRSWWPQHLLQKFKGASYNITQGNVNEGQIWAGKNAATWGTLGFTAMLPIYGLPVALGTAIGAVGLTLVGKPVNSIGFKKDLVTIIELSTKNTINTLPIVSKLLGKVLGRDKLLPTDKIDLLGGVTVEELYKDHVSGTNNAVPAAIRGLSMLLANVSKMGMLMALSSLLLYDDDDEEDDVRRKTYNLVSNNATTFYNQSFEIINLVYQFETMMKSPSSTFIGNVARVFQNIGTEKNPNTGEYKFMESLKRLPPGVFGYVLGDGESSANRKFKVTQLDIWMRKLANEDAREIKKEIKAERKAYREELERQQVFSEKEIEEMVNEQIPTYSKLVEDGLIVED